MKRVVIIGGGIAGLSAAYSLREHSKGAEFEIVIIEKRPSLGGNIRTEKKDGFLIEGGPDCFLSEKPWCMELCKRIGLGDKLLGTNEEQKKTFVLSRGRLHELPEGVILMIPTKVMPFVTSTLISWPGKIRMGLDLFVPKRKDKSDETLGSFVRRRLGAEALDKIAEPLVAGVHAGDPETMSVRASFPKFVQMEEEHGSLIRGMLRKMAQMRLHRQKTSSGAEGAKTAPPAPSKGPRITMFMTLRDGLSELIDTLTAKVKACSNTIIMTETGVKRVAKKDGGYEVRLDSGKTIDAESVIVAAPAYAAAEVIKGIDAGLSEKLLTIPYVSTATVSIGFRRKEVKHPMNGFGFVVPKSEGRRIMAATWTSVKFNGRAPGDSVLIRCFVGGAKNNELVSLNDDEMIRMVREELRDIMGIDAEPVIARVFRWINSMPQYTVGHEDRIAEIEEKVAAHSGLYLTGSAYHGIGISDSIRYGEVVAKKALHHIGI